MSKTKSTQVATGDTSIAAAAAGQLATTEVDQATDEADGVYGDPSLPPVLGGSYVVENGRMRLIDRTQHE